MSLRAALVGKCQTRQQMRELNCYILRTLEIYICSFRRCKKKRLEGQQKQGDRKCGIKWSDGS